MTPWRTIQIADRAADLAPSVIGLNLNPPSVIANTDWIKPMKYVGIWWGMHINTMTWSSGPKHGATTANAKRYIDFAAANGLGGVLVEGWNTGWDGDWIQNRNAFSFTKAYPDYDLAEVARYAHSKGIHLIVHNETSGGIENYERQMDSAFALYHSLGLDAIKTGYVTDTAGGGQSHHGQYMVHHYRHVIETAAQYGIMVDAHEPIHDTGERRTYPNMMSREGARGQEYNAWGAEGGNPPEHETNLFFTRMLAGPMDFTPGIFDILLERGTGRPRRPDESRPRTTLAKQLALYVVLYSPLQMAADLPENYENKPAFQFIRDVAVDWDTTRVIDGKIGDYVIVARKAAQLAGVVHRRHHGRGGAHVRCAALVPAAGTQVRRGDLRRRTERELAHQSAAGDDLEATGDLRDRDCTSCWRRAADRRSGFGRRREPRHSDDMLGQAFGSRSRRGLAPSLACRLAGRASACSSRSMRARTGITFVERAPGRHRLQHPELPLLLQRRRRRRRRHQQRRTSRPLLHVEPRRQPAVPEQRQLPVRGHHRPRRRRRLGRVEDRRDDGRRERRRPTWTSTCPASTISEMHGRNVLYINNGDGTFTDRTKEYGLDFEGYSTQALFFDYDNDGDLDMYLLNHSVHTEHGPGNAASRIERHPRAGDRLYRNDGGHFVDVSAAGRHLRWRARATAWASSRATSTAMAAWTSTSRTISRKTISCITTTATARSRRSGGTATAAHQPFVDGRRRRRLQ